MLCLSASHTHARRYHDTCMNDVVSFEIHVRGHFYAAATLPVAGDRIGDCPGHCIKVESLQTVLP